MIDKFCMASGGYGSGRNPFFGVRPAGRTHLEVQVLYRPGKGNC